MLANTPSVATPTQNSKSRKEKPRDAIRLDAGKPTPIVATPIFPTPTKDSESSEEPRDAIRQNACKLTPNVTTPGADCEYSIYERRDPYEVTLAK
jgi:hypothetical protein